MRKSILLSLSILFCAAVSAQVPQLVKKWETDTLLKVPESVLYDEKSKVLYVTNIDGTDPWAEDGKGSVAKVGLDGKIISAEWITGLNAPKGMGLHKGKLYVADLKNVFVIDVATGKVDNKIEVAGAQGLNDISVDEKGVVYVSDMPGKKIWRLDNGKQEMLLENLNRPNGVLAHKNDIFVLDNGTLLKMNHDKSLTKIAEGLDGGTDGIENIGGNNYIVSCWGGVLWHVNTDGTKTNLLDTREKKINAADIGYDAKNRIVYVPTFWKNSVVAYELK
jgi:YVTN family beta-propeller protein